MPSKPTRQRLSPEVFDLPVEKMRAGWYTDAYFNHTRATLLADGRHPRVVVQVFQKNDAWLGGVDEAIAILRLCSDEPDGLTIRALFGAHHQVRASQTRARSFGVAAARHRWSGA